MAERQWLEYVGYGANIDFQYITFICLIKKKTGRRHTTNNSFDLTRATSNTNHFPQRVGRGGIYLVSLWAAIYNIFVKSSNPPKRTETQTHTHIFIFNTFFFF